MLTKLALKNFKAWHKADLRFSKVTGFFGPNSAGKSSLLQFLLLLKQTKNATDRGLVLDFGSQQDLANLGTFNDVVHQHDDDRHIWWRLDWTLPKPLRIGEPTSVRPRRLLQGDSLQVQCSVGLEGERLCRQQLEYRFSDVVFKLQPKVGSSDELDLAAEGGSFEFLRTRGRPQKPRPTKTHLFPNEVKSNYQNSDFLGDFELEYENLIDSLYYLGPLRVYPQRQYHWGGASPTDVGPRGERTMDAILAATRDRATKQLKPRARWRPFQEIIAHWLKELGLIQDFRLDEIAKGTNLYQAMVKTPQSGVPTALTDVGFGVSQVLPVLVLLYYVPEGSTVLMEQPEIHLHPAVQSGLADVMLNVATMRKVQIVVESHSEHLMRRLQRRVAEDAVSSEDVRLYFVSSQQSQAHATDLCLNEWGEIENWPDNFFGDEMGEIAARTKASLQRRLVQSE